MAAGETPQVQYQQGSQPRGRASQANALMATVPQMSPTPGIDEAQQFQPSTPAEQFAFGPSHRPNEPITAGVPFGAGPLASVNFTSDGDIVKSVAQQLLTDPNAGKDSKTWAARALAGD